jgi:transcriptional regulator with XRE-family HTH domain
MHAPDHCDQVQSVTLGAFLKALRIRIHCEVRALGPHERLPSRLGKRVTQEEIAEAVGVSRVWYCRLESDASARASMRVLNRLADVLMLSADERVRVIQLAIPETQRVGLCNDSVTVLEGFSRMRAAAKRLWAATSESEALAEASEQLATWFPDVAQIGSARRLDVGVWDTRLLEPPVDSTKRFEEFIRELSASFATAEDLDQVFVFPQLVQPGETGMVLQLFSPLIRRGIDDALARAGLGRGSVDCFDARVRSRSGLIACLGLFQGTGRPFSETDQAILSTIAQLTSYALS